jgi:ABC-type siderophore export system fused ATPase/permease subunit
VHDVSVVAAGALVWHLRWIVMTLGILVNVKLRSGMGGLIVFLLAIIAGTLLFGSNAVLWTLAGIAILLVVLLLISSLGTIFEEISIYKKNYPKSENETDSVETRKGFDLKVITNTINKYLFLPYWSFLREREYQKSNHTNGTIHSVGRALGLVWAVLIATIVWLFVWGGLFWIVYEAARSFLFQ